MLTRSGILCLPSSPLLSLPLGSNIGGAGIAYFSRPQYFTAPNLPIYTTKNGSASLIQTTSLAKEMEVVRRRPRVLTEIDPHSEWVRGLEFDTLVVDVTGLVSAETDLGSF
jgi:hypothetical protein